MRPGLRQRARHQVFFGVIALGLLSAGSAGARTYTDTKKRFEVDLPSGWEISPVPGDTRGMRFKKTRGDQFAMIQVSVKTLKGGETVQGTLDDYTAPFSAEIGYRKGEDLPSSVGLLPASSRRLSVFASGDKRTVRSIDVHVLHAFGHAHIVHFETLEKNRDRFLRDLDRFLAGYKPLAGRKVYGPLVARWRNTGAGPDLILDETGGFTLGPLEGTFVADGGRITLHVKEGKEWYRYQLKGRELTLKSPNLDEPSRYQRSGAARFALEEREKSRVKPLSRRDLIGRWRALDVPGTEPLVLHLAATGSVSFGDLGGQWWYQRGLLTIRSTSGRTVTYHVSRAKKGRLILGGGDLDEEIKLELEAK